MSNDVLRLKLLGADATAPVGALDELPGKANYFLGNDPAKWRLGVPTYAKVKYEGVYPGVDLIYYGHQRQLEYDFVVAPGADPAAITLSVGAGLVPAQGPPQGSPLRLADNGDLVITTNDGEVRFRKPVVYQPGAAMSSSPSGDQALQLTTDHGPRTTSNRQSPIANRQFLDGRYVLLADNRITFEVGAYDHRRPLIIDPVLSYSTYLGGSGIDAANGIAVGIDGTAFVAGQTKSTDFPVVHSLQPNAGGPPDFPDDAFVSKLSADGSTLLYSTYLGGKSQDQANGIAVDGFGDAYVIGTTLSPDFPVTAGAANTLCGADGKCGASWNPGGFIVSNAFVTKLNPEGSAIVYSTYVGFYENVLGQGIAVDANQIAYITGSTSDNFTPTVPIAPPNVPPPPFPIVNAAQAVYGGGSTDAFLAKISATGSGIQYSTYLGGSDEDVGYGVAVDGNANAYITGLTYSPNLPVVNALQAVYGGAGDAFFAKVNTNSSGVASLNYSTYLGSNGLDRGNGVAVDSTGMAYITGGVGAGGLTFPTSGAFTGGVSDAFAAKINPTLVGAASEIYFLYFGGAGAESGAGIAVDAAGNAYVTGITNSTNFPTAGTPFQSTYGGGNADAFVAKVNPGGTALVYSSFLGGSNADSGAAIAVDSFGNAYVTGQTCSTNFPTHVPEQPAPGGNCDAFVSKILTGAEILISPASLTFPTQGKGSTSLPQTITITSNGDSALTLTGIAVTGTNSADFAQTNSCPLSPSTLAAGSSCTISVTFTSTTGSTESGTISVTDNNNGVANSTQTVPLTGLATEVFAVPTKLDFGTQPVSTTSLPQSITLKNGGGLTLDVSSITTSGDFAVTTQTCSATLAPGANCTINIDFTPTAAGIRNGSLTVTDSDPSSPQTVVLTGQGLAPLVTLTLSGAPVTSLTFGNQAVGSASAAQNVTLTNTGSAPLIISGVSTTGDFAQANTCGASVAANAFCTISVTFLPTAAGNRYGSLTISDNAGNSPQTVALAGFGTSAPIVTLTPSSLGFGNQPVNSTSAAQTVVLANTGTATLNIAANGTALTGANAGDFAETNNCPASIAAGSNCTIFVTFSPTAAGTRLAAVSITDDAAGSPQSVALSGTGVLAPSVTLSVNSLTFASQPQGTTSTAQTVTLTNSGSAALNITGITITGDFAQTNNCPTSVAPAATCTISVTFTPNASGARTGTLAINDNAAGSPQTVSLAGTGATAPLVTLSPASLTFAGQVVGTTSAAQTVTMTNGGSALLTITSITVSGDFAQTNNCGGTLAAGANCAISVTFTPSVVGARTGVLTINDSATGSPQTASLSGPGSDFSLVTTPASATIFAGDTASYTLTLTPLFNFNTKISFACSGAPPQGNCQVSPATVTLDGTNPGTVTVSVPTAARTNAGPRGGIKLLPPLGPAISTILLIILVLIVISLGSAYVPRRRWAPLPLRWMPLCGLFLLGAMLLWGSCGGGGTSSNVPAGTPAGSYTLTVTAASGSLTHNITLKLTVN